MNRSTFGRALSVSMCLLAGRAGAQAENPSVGEILKQLQSLQKRFEALEDTHRKDQERIGELETRLQRLEAPSSTEADALERTRIQEEIRAQLGGAEVPAASAGPFDLSAGGFGAGTAFNPQITVFLDTGGSLSSRGRNQALNRFNLREVELDLRSAISPSADGVLIIAVGEEIESDLRGDVSITRDVDVEEGYIDFHSLPHDLSLRIGRFRAPFGRNNLLHTHDLPQVTRPSAVQAFLGAEGLITTGASVGWLVPNPWDKYVEATVSVVNADGGSESPILGGPNAEDPAVVAHVKFFDDLTDTSSVEIGGSYLFGRTSGDADFDANVFGLDLTYRWLDPDPSLFRSLLLQSELFWGQNDVDRGAFRSGRNDSFGAYVAAQYQLHRDWYVGLRADYTEFPDSDARGTGDYDFALSPNVTWYITEFLRARLEYQHRIFHVDDDSRSEEAVFLQFTGVFGSHPPHPYWVNR